MNIPLANGRLGRAAVERYWEDGYLHPIRAISPAQAAEWRAELEAIERDWLDAGLPLPLNTYKRVNANCVMPLAHRIATHPAILDVVEGVLGPDLLIYGVEFFIKEPRTKHRVSMHQDLTYWGLGAIDGMVTMWLALSPATRASGCMDFVAGSHRNPILPHEDTFAEDNLLSRGQEVRVEVAPEDRVAIELMPGEISLHHGLTIHGSGPNTTDDRRIGAVVRYLRPEVAQEVGEQDYAMLARGADRARNFILFAPPEGNFTPESLALYDEIRTTQGKFLMKGTKNDKGLYAKVNA
ncbi:MAG: phytanoyl-CoA dioxygenase family protein [Rhodobacteraceae bacterium]|uniref:phytanoyl-CoA dioxygenase family protein n=1 Tax=Albidovulum sp. TaxID=1872424 RepID=UPI001D216751|nr:phytanoyl-CoA dioxygenase family protein [Paracoccaceae bacterium]MCC0047159.1 phytanoyl-CoA dioxygenase family protein [Defluviimonas sp.]HPE25230.1 phytanoyl-CoA dioxygenase family protein [Albidovulum sp.]MCB2123053.1 phytanoyl-CoA dioxygenase family protein [Paracoccaceae bacterium]MCB2140733.1 phytanoyl-CoA dioxygenase family protein [Paracoccaceae bacterium]